MKYIDYFNFKIIKFFCRRLYKKRLYFKLFLLKTNLVVDIQLDNVYNGRVNMCRSISTLFYKTLKEDFL